MEMTLNIHYPQVSLNLLNRLRTKQITLEEFLKECAYWALKNGFEELRPHPYPTPPTTQAFMEYETLSPIRKAKVEQKFFYKNPEINEHYAQRFRIKWKNKHTLEWLKEVKSHIPAEDELFHKKLDERIFEFKAVEDELSLEAERLKETFDAQEV